jgi:hypothetical protein
MDYNWLENVPSSVTAAPVFSPDFSFLQSMQMRANQQYEQGLSKVANTYASVFNTPVTGDEANQRQRDYAKEAMAKMKAVSATDLSDPKNVYAAENIITPYLSDKELTQNMANTKGQNNQINDYYSYLNSSDKDKRALVDPDALEYMQRGLKKLGETPLNEQNKWSVRNFVPTYDINADADAEYNKLFGKDGGVKSTYSSGPTTETVTNGPKSKDAFRAWYLNRLDNQGKYGPQLQMKATLNMERSMDQIQAEHYRQTGQKLSDSDLKSAFTGETINELKNYYTTAIGSVNKTTDYWDNEIEKFKKGTPNILPGSPEAAHLDELVANKNNWKDIADDYQNQYSKTLGYDPRTKDININSPAYAATLREISEHPESYLASIHRGQMADNWANSMAGFSQVETKANAAWNNVTEHEDRIAALRSQNWRAMQSNQLGEERLDEKAQEFYMKYGFLPPNSGSGSLFGVGTSAPGIVGKNGMVQPDIASGDVYHDITNPQQVPVTIQTYHDNQEALRNSINNQVFSYDGIAGIMGKSVLGKNGLDNEDIISWTEGMRNARNGIPMNIKQQESADKVRTLMTKYDIPYNENKPGSVMVSTLGFVQKVADQLRDSPDPADAIKAVQMVEQLNNIKWENDKYNTNEETYRKNVADLIRGDRTGKYKTLLNPDTHLPYTVEDIAGQLQPTSSHYSEDGKWKEKVFSSMELARAWDKGEVTPGSGSSPATVTVNGKRYEIPAGSVAGLANHFGNYENYNTLTSDAGTEIAKNMSDYKNGQISGVVRYDLSGKDANVNPVQRATGIELGASVITPENNIGLYTLDDKNKPDLTGIDREMKLALEGKNRDWIADNVAKVEYVQHGPNGVGSVKLTLNPTEKVQKTPSSGEKEDIAIRDKKVIYADISPNASGKLIQSLPSAHNIFTYGQILEGQSIHSDPSIEAFGVRYNISPNTQYKDNVSGRYTQAIAHVEHIKINPTTGLPVKDEKGEPVWETDIDPSTGKDPAVNLMRGQKAVSPDEMMSGINGYISNYIRDKAARVKMAAQQPVPDGAIPVEEYLKKKSGEIGNQTNNASNIKYTPEMGKLGAVPSGIKATDGGQFASFPTPEAGLNVYKKLLFGTTDGTFHSSFYKPDTTVDQAMRTWSNNGYGGEIYPDIANKKLGQLSAQERSELIKRQLQRESPKTYNILKKQGLSI